MECLINLHFLQVIISFIICVADSCRNALLQKNILHKILNFLECLLLVISGSSILIFYLTCTSHFICVVENKIFFKICFFFVIIWIIFFSKVLRDEYPIEVFSQDVLKNHRALSQVFLIYRIQVKTIYLSFWKRHMRNFVISFCSPLKKSFNISAYEKMETKNKIFDIKSFGMFN